MRAALAILAVVLLQAPLVRAEEPEVIVKRLRDDAGECHYVLSLCSDAVRADGALARLRTAGENGEPAPPEQIAAAEARVAKQVDLLTRAAAAVRARHAEAPACFRHCARLAPPK
jgi:hypothetical protein